MVYDSENTGILMDKPRIAWSTDVPGLSAMQAVNRQATGLASMTVHGASMRKMACKTSMLHVVLNIYKCVFVVFGGIYHINAQEADKDCLCHL